MQLQQTNYATLLKPSTKHTLKVTALLQNLIDVTKFSEGTSKLIIDSLDRISVSSLPSKIYKNINLTHPIVKLLVDDIERLSKIGDNGMYFIKITAALLKIAIEGLETGVEAKKMAKILKEVREKVGMEKFWECEKAKMKGKGATFANKKSSLAAKLVADALKIAKKAENVKICKILSGEVDESEVVEGIILPKKADGKAQCKKNAKCAIFNCALDVLTTETKGNIQFSTADQMLAYASEEECGIEKFVEQNSAEVIFFHGQLGNLHKELFDEKDVLLFKIQSKFDLRRIVDLSGATATNFLVFKEENFGTVDVESWEENGDNFTRIGGNGKIATIVLRGSLNVNVDEMEREIALILNSVLKNKNATMELKIAENAIVKVVDKISEGKSDQSLIILGRIRAFFAEKREKEEINVYGMKKSLKCAFDMVELLLLTDDYLITMEDELSVKPRDNKNWDDDDVMC